MSAQSSTNYPQSLDSPQSTTENDYLGTLGGLDLPTVTNFIYGMIEAIQTKLGIDNSAVNNTIDYRVRNGWNVEAASVAYLSTSSFTVNTNKTAIYTIGTKIRINSASTPIYCIATSSSYNSGSGLTTVNVDQSVVPNPINSLDYAIQPEGSKLITQSQVSIQNPTSSQVGGLTHSNMSSSAGILGSQLDPAAGIVAGQMAVANPTSAQLSGVGKNNVNISQLGLNDFVLSGFTTSGQSGLAITIGAGTLFIGGIFYSLTGDGGHTYTASKDTYVDLDTSNVYHYVAVANGAASPSLTANSVRLRKVITNGSAITATYIQAIDSLGNVIYPTTPFYNVDRTIRSWDTTNPVFQIGAGSDVGNNTFEMQIGAPAGNGFWPFGYCVNGVRVFGLMNSGGINSALPVTLTSGFQETGYTGDSWQLNGTVATNYISTMTNLKTYLTNTPSSYSYNETSSYNRNTPSLSVHQTYGIEVGAQASGGGQTFTVGYYTSVGN